MCSVCVKWEQRVAAGMVMPSTGAVAQLVERVHGMDEVARSIRVGSTLGGLAATWRALGFFFGGLVAGEGTFCVSKRGSFFKDGSPRLRFVFQVSLASWDRPLLEALQRYLGCGSICDQTAGKEHWQPKSTYTLASQRAHRAVTIPFAERFLLPSAKSDQFDAWRERLRAYEDEHPTRMYRGRSLCSEDGCDRVVRGQGLCRIHYYRVTGY